jgi:hypothetical protein
MRATLNISDELVSQVQKISGEKSKTKAISIAMEEYVRQKKIKELIALRGKIQIDYDWEKEEKLELKAQKKREKLLEKRT